MSRGNSDYADRNRELFAQRNEIAGRLAAVEGATSPAKIREHRMLTSELDRIKSKIVELNQGLVGDYCRQFSAHSPNLAEEYFSAGLEGLMTAINSYNLDKGASFAHWAYRMIQRKVLIEVREQEHSTIGQSDFENRQSILAAQQDLEVENPGRNVSAEAVAKRASVSVPQAKRVMAPPRLLSIDKQTDASDSGSAAEFVEAIPNSDESVEDAAMRHMDSAALAAIAQEFLNPRERFVVARRFGLDGEPAQTLAAVGAMLKLSRESVRNVQAQAMSKLAQPEVRKRLVAEVGLAQELAEVA